MGYTVTLPYSTIELSTGLKADYDNFTNLGWVTNVVNLVTIPTYPTAPDYAYVDVIIQKMIDTSGASNYLLANSEIQLRDTGLTYRTAATLAAGAMYVEANATINTYYVIPGNVNVAQYVTPGEQQMIAIYGKAQGNALGYRGTSGRLRLYFNAR